jgi:hypothetical protein
MRLPKYVRIQGRETAWDDFQVGVIDEEDIP